MIVEWDTAGYQTMKISRGCVPSDWAYPENPAMDNTPCRSNEDRFPPADPKFKECQITCDDDGCNDVTHEEQLLEMFDKGEDGIQVSSIFAIALERHFL